jgi:UDP-glucose 4-epimerase
MVATGHDVTVLDLRRAEVTDAKSIVGDIADDNVLDKVLPGKEAVLHLAGRIDAAESLHEPAVYFRTNTAATFVLLAGLVRHRVPRFVYSSTASLYDAGGALSEVSPLRPTTPYSASKLAVEHALPFYRHLKTVILRYFNAAGATKNHGERHEPESHLIPLALEVAEGLREHLVVHGTDYATPDGTAIRDYVHVQDIAAAHVHALTIDEPFTVYNIGSGTGWSVDEVVKACRRATGRPIRTVDGPRRSGDHAVLVADTRKILQAGWRPRFGLEAMIESAWTWRHAH